MSVKTKHTKLKELEQCYQLVIDVLAGEQAVKAKRELYLPRPCVGLDEKSLSRYAAYLKRAVFYEKAAGVLNSWCSLLFVNNYELELPSEMEYLRDNIDGYNVTIDQLAKKIARNVLSLGRCGILTDFVNAPGSKGTASDLRSGKSRPKLVVVSSDNIINWKELELGYEYIVIKVESKAYDKVSKFESKNVIEYWELAIINDGYVIRKHIGEDSITNTIPRNVKGEPFKEIQFDFIGSSNNNASPDYPLMYTFASLNIGHYRNSADWEESCFTSGQNTLVLIGQGSKAGNVIVGENGVISLTAGADAKYLKASTDCLAMEGMKHKEALIADLGVSMTSDNKTAISATESDINNTNSTSLLKTVSQNVSQGLESALKRCALLIGANPNEVKFKLNDFTTTEQKGGSNEDKNN